MEGERWYLRSNDNKAALASFVATLDVSNDRPYVAQIIPWTKKRSIDQNSLAHKWYGEISVQGGEYTPVQVKARCKDKWGVPIMLAASPSFAKAWEPISGMEYETKMEILEWFPVTSLMDTKQMAQYLTALERTMCQKYQLTNPALYGLPEMRKAG